MNLEQNRKGFTDSAVRRRARSIMRITLQVKRLRMTVEHLRTAARSQLRRAVRINNVFFSHLRMREVFLAIASIDVQIRSAMVDEDDDLTSVLRCWRAFVAVLLRKTSLPACVAAKKKVGETQDGRSERVEASCFHQLMVSFVVSHA